ncbi:MAG: ATP-binding protein, partial [Pseudomonadota bacterium]
LENGNGRNFWYDQFHAILALDPADTRPGEGAFFDRVHPDDRARLAGALDRVVSGASARLTEDFRIVRADGEERVAQLRAQSVQGDDGRATRVDLTLQDISERKRMEDKLDALVSELRRSNEELEQFAYVASHDLRQPLRVVGSYVTLIEESIEDKLDRETREFMDFIRDGVRRMDLLITDLLAYSRVGRTSRDGPVDTGRALDLALMDLQVEIDEAGAVVDHPDRMPVVTGDAGEMTRLFQNLIGNAVKYRSAERPSRVTVGCLDEGGLWHFWVRDNGIGIPPEHADRVFGIFQRLHARDEYEGTGIGLAICKKVVERQGGRIWIEPRANDGTTFHFTWPKLRRLPDAASAA